MNRRYNAVTLQQATEASPALASLAERVRDTNERMRAIQDLIPPEMRPGLQAGPAEGDTWCLLVGNSAAAAKLRHMVPALTARLRTRGWDVTSLRIKVRSHR
ncbi:DciA family protein [Variovorax sp. J22R133]|uniref:DciA family protein n=1 Tax=Variovorax brevis TaxID=3053503 RepID=UPI0025767FDD|nr:DciA family protein [Variovorax sp. J22R133]MDM0113621.1 DciA family protein [Variovorax sp. J22R133]